MALIITSNLENFTNDLSEVANIFALEPDTEITHEQRFEGGGFSDAVKVVFEGNLYEHIAFTPYAEGGDPLSYRRFSKRAGKNALFDCLKAATGKRTPWGSLTGIRPTRLVNEISGRGLDEAEAKAALMDEFRVEEGKADLLIATVRNQRPVLASQRDYDLDVYISIPFCVTRCHYCSFPGASITRFQKQVQPYVDAVCAEIEAFDTAGYSPRCLYIGGGTPTSLACVQLERIISAALSKFGPFVEVCCEAGRPDTLDRDKLEMLKALGITRMTINPQTLCDATLQAVGRDHSAKDIADCYALARELGFDNINMDIILGLPGEGLYEVRATLDGVIALAPENLTVHTLALKRASKLAQGSHRHTDSELVSDMVELSYALLSDAGYSPYYLYRQKYMAGNFENVGYCKGETPCLYNIDIMEETTSIAAFGAGAISKRVFKDRTLRIERQPNPKDVIQYNERLSGIISKKAEFFAP